MYNRLGWKCTTGKLLSAANAGLEDFYIPHSGCTFISGKRLIVESEAVLSKTEDCSN